MFTSGIIIALYFWTFFSGPQFMGAGLLITSNSVILSAVTFILSFISYLWSPTKFILPTALTVYGLLVLTTGTLIANTSGLSSPFVALWVAVSAFAAVFGLYGLVPMALVSSSYLILSSLDGNLDQAVFTTTVIVGYLPLIASYIIWHRKSGGENGKDRSLRDLASELSQVANKSEVVINAIGDGVIAIDSQGVIQLINPAAQEIAGWGKQDALHLDYKSVLKLVDKNNKELTPANDPIQAALADNNQIRTSNFSLVTNSEKRLLISLVVSPVGQPGAGVIIVFRDITKEKAEEREQAEFISTASHEMRTPVASIEGYLGLALNPATAQIDDKARDFINKAHEASQHLGRLLQDLLDVSKAEDGRLSNNPKVVDVVHFIHTVIDGLRPQAEAKNLRFLFKPDPETEEKQGDRHLNPVFFAQVDNDHLREIVANLVENAIKYTNTGDVTVDITGDTSHVTVSVTDSGVGIPTEDISHLFQKFYRVDNSDTREIGGTGLGLYLCRRLAEVIGGRIWVESVYKKGSTFFLEIPRISHEEATKLIEASSQQDESNLPEPTTFEPAPQPSPASAAPAAEIPTDQPLISTITVSPPAEQVADQLKSIEASRSVTADANPAAPIQPPQTAGQSKEPNTPLSEIESNPAAYTQSRQPGIPIPVRTPDQDDKA